MNKTLIVVAVCMLAALSVYAESITMPVFYPSPQGDYETLYTSSTTRLAMSGGSVNVGSPPISGGQMLNVNGDVMVDRTLLLDVVSGVASPRGRIRTTRQGIHLFSDNFDDRGLHVRETTGFVKCGNGWVVAAGEDQALHIDGTLTVTQSGSTGQFQVNCPGDGFCYAVPAYS